MDDKMSLKSIYNIIDLCKSAKLDGDDTEVIIRPIENNQREITIGIKESTTRRYSFTFEDGKKFDDYFLPRLLDYFIKNDDILSWTFTNPNMEDATAKSLLVTKDNNEFLIQSFNKSEDYIENLRNKINELHQNDLDEDKTIDTEYTPLEKMCGVVLKYLKGRAIKKDYLEDFEKNFGRKKLNEAITIIYDIYKENENKSIQDDELKELIINKQTDDNKEVCKVLLDDLSMPSHFIIDGIKKYIQNEEKYKKYKDDGIFNECKKVGIKLLNDGYFNFSTIFPKGIEILKLTKEKLDEITSEKANSRYSLLLKEKANYEKEGNSEKVKIIDGFISFLVKTRQKLDLKKELKTNGFEINIEQPKKMKLNEVLDVIDLYRNARVDNEKFKIHIYSDRIYMSLINSLSRDSDVVSLENSDDVKEVISYVLSTKKLETSSENELGTTVIEASDNTTITIANKEMIPLKDMALIPTKEIAIVPPREIATIPSKEMSTLPPREIAVTPSKEMSTLPPREIAVTPSKEIATLPSREIATIPSKEMSTLPPREIATIPNMYDGEFGRDNTSNTTNDFNTERKNVTEEIQKPIVLSDKKEQVIDREVNNENISIELEKEESSLPDISRYIRTTSNYFKHLDIINNTDVNEDEKAQIKEDIDRLSIINPYIVYFEKLRKLEKEGKIESDYYNSKIDEYKKVLTEKLKQSNSSNSPVIELQRIKESKPNNVPRKVDDEYKVEVVHGRVSEDRINNRLEEIKNKNILKEKNLINTLEEQEKSLPDISKYMGTTSSYFRNLMLVNSQDTPIDSKKRIEEKINVMSFINPYVEYLEKLRKLAKEGKIEEEYYSSKLATFRDKLISKKNSSTMALEDNANIINDSSPDKTIKLDENEELSIDTLFEMIKDELKKLEVERTRESLYSIKEMISKIEKKLSFDKEIDAEKIIKM